MTYLHSPGRACVTYHFLALVAGHHAHVPDLVRGGFVEVVHLTVGVLTANGVSAEVLQAFL